MKKIILILTAFLCLQVFPQNRAKYYYLLVEGASYEPEAAAYFNSTTGLTTARKDTVNQFISMLKDSLSITNLSDFFASIVIPQKTQANSLIDLITTNTNTLNGTVTFAPDRGFTSDGSTGYIATTVTPSTNALLGQNDYSIGAYNRTTPNLASRSMIGTTPANGTINIYMNIRSGNQILCKFNDNTELSQTGVANTGFYISTRRGATDVEGYRNGVSVLTGSTASVGVSDKPFFILCRNGNGTATSFHTGQLSTWYIGKKVTDEQARKIYNCFLWYLTAIGANI